MLNEFTPRSLGTESKLIEYSQRLDQFQRTFPLSKRFSENWASLAAAPE